MTTKLRCLDCLRLIVKGERCGSCATKRKWAAGVYADRVAKARKKRAAA